MIRLNRFADLSIKQKQMFILMVTSAVALLLASAGFVLYELLVFEGDMKAGLGDLAVDIGRDSSGALLFNNPEAAKTSFQRFLQNHPAVVGACIYTTDGADAFALYPPGFKAPAFPQVPATKRGLTSLSFAQNTLDIFVRVDAGAEGGEPITVPIYLRSSLGPIYDRLRRYAA